MNIQALLKLMNQELSRYELELICTDLGVDYARLPGTVKEDKCVELLAFASSWQKLEALLHLIADYRPDLDLSPFGGPEPKLTADETTAHSFDQTSGDSSTEAQEGERDALSWLDNIASGQGQALDEPPTLSWNRSRPPTQPPSEDESFAWLEESGPHEAAIQADLESVTLEEDLSQTWLNDLEDGLVPPISEELVALASQEARQIRAALLPHEDSAAFQLVFSVGTASGDGPSFHAQESESEDPFIPLHLQTFSADFELNISGGRTLHLPPRGRSPNQVLVGIEPAGRRTGALTAVWRSQSNIVQADTWRLDFGVSSLERVPIVEQGVERAAALEPIDASLLVMARESDHLFMLAGEQGESAAVLALGQDEMHQLVREGRQAIYEGIGARVARLLVEQSRMEVLPELDEVSLRKLGRVGYHLFQQLFFGSGSDATAQQLGRAIQRLVGDPPITIQIVGEMTGIPWGLLYAPQTYQPHKIETQSFLGAQNRLLVHNIQAVG